MTTVQELRHTLFQIHNQDTIITLDLLKSLVPDLDLSATPQNKIAPTKASVNTSTIEKPTVPTNLRELFLAVDSPDAFDSFYHKYLHDKWGRNLTSEDKKAYIRIFRLDDLRRAYNFVYSHPVPPARSKEYIVHSIARYFDSIARAKSLKP